MKQFDYITKEIDFITKDKIDNAYQELLAKKSTFALVKSEGKNFCLTKEKSMFEIDNVEKFTQNASNDVYFQTFQQKSVKKLKNLHLYMKLVNKYKKDLTNNFEGYMFGCVAVREDDGFITTIRGKKNLDEYTFVENVDFEKYQVHVQGQKATLNAPLIAHLFKNPKVFAVLHFHVKENKNYPTYDYYFPGTMRDSIRCNKTSFNIAHHGVFLLLDENLDIIDEQFNNKYPHHEVYEQMYKRYFSRDLDEFVNIVDVQKSDNVIDLCGGNARLTRKLIKYSNHVCYLDQEKDMIPDDLKNLGVRIYNMSIQQFVASNCQKFDKAFCIQAVNYWLEHIDICKFANCFKTGGKFVFNTFNTKPSSKPSVKEYTIDGKNFVEISYLLDEKIVQHIQICEGFLPHLTQFDFISREKFKKLLGKYFEIDIITKNKTDIYVCTRKGL